MNLPPRLTIARAQRLLQSIITSQQLCLHSLHLASFGENDLRLNAYTKVLSAADIAQQAVASDERIKSGRAKSMLDGIPVTIKANIAVGRWWELPTACSAILSHDKSCSENTSSVNDAVYESDIARKLLKECGAVLIGITNMDEFGMGSLGTNVGRKDHSVNNQQQYAPTYNPLPWMQRIAMLTGQGANLNNDLDELFTRKILESTSSNPHGLNDDALQQLTEEVHYWTSSSNHTKADKSQSPLLSPGGSSSGAAVATAHGSSLLSIGTDTGGSLRLPAAWTSTVGFKPTYGSLSRYGVVSYASSLDTVGFVTASSECADIAWRCLSNDTASPGNSRNVWNAQNCRDPTARVYHTRRRTDSQTSADELNSNTRKPLEGLRIGIPSAFSLHEAPSLVSSMWSQGANLLKSKGATIVAIPESKVSSQWVRLSCAAYYVLACAEASSNLSRYDGVRYGTDYKPDSTEFAITPENHNYSAFNDMTILEEQISATRAYGFGEEVQRRVLTGTSVLSSDRFHTHYEAAAIVRAKLSQSLENVFHHSDEYGVDLVLVPTALSFPMVLDPNKGAELDSTSAFANDVMTIPISLGGFPSVSVPFSNASTDSLSSGTSPSNHVVGLQLFGPRGSENYVLKAARVLHREDSIVN
eukprot:scaffold93540_cov80-Cyclotella_meneghiniana.AAC.2